MIAVIGVEYSLNKIRCSLGDNYKGYDITYCPYTSTLDMKNIITSFTNEVDAILIAGIVAYSRFASLKINTTKPCIYIDYDNAEMLSFLFNAIIDYSHVPLNKIYIDFFQLFTLKNKTFYYLFPEKVRDNVCYFDFKDDVSLRYDKIYNDIKQKYSNNEIELVVCWSKEYGKKITSLGLDCIVYEDMHFQQATKYCDKLINLIKKDSSKKLLKYTLAVHYKDKEEKTQIIDLLKSVGYINISHEFKNKILCSLNSKELHYNNDKLVTTISSQNILRSNPLLCLGIGEGRSESESKINAMNAIQYSKTYGLGSCFLVTENKNIIGPANQISCLSISEFEIIRLEDTARNLGIKVFNLCRLLALFENEKFLTNREVSQYLNVALKSSNRILNTLLNNKIVDATKIKSVRAGRPELVYTKLQNI